MKRIASFFLILLLLVGLSGCKTSPPKNKEVTLTFVYAEADIQVILPEEEANRVIEILDGKAYGPAFTVPSCGFDKNVSLKVGHQVYAIACDECPTFQDLGNLKYFSVNQSDADYIRSLFEKYGGYFPCI